MGPNLYNNEYNEFDATVFKKFDFDFILAQSIFSHTGTSLFIHLLKSFRKVLSSDGLALITIIHVHDLDETSQSRDRYNGYEWIYPGVTEFHRNRISSFLKEADLHGESLSWYHPRQTWWVLSRSRSRVTWAKTIIDPKNQRQSLNVYAPTTGGWKIQVDPIDQSVKYMHI